jgi:acetoin utilization protein AcuB
MSKPVPPISKHMTTSPHTIGAEQTIASAAKVMREHRIRHLPVLHGGKVVGILSDRDVHMVETLKDVDPQVVTVEDAMTSSPYVADANTSLTEVASTMAEHKYGSVIVTQNQKVVGVFTTVDACRVLAEVFETRLK